MMYIAIVLGTLLPLAAQVSTQRSLVGTVVAFRPEVAVSNVAFEEVFPIARELARQKALRVIGCCGLAPDDRDDVARQLVATFYSRFGKFDGGRASVRTFASRVMDKELASILRY